MAGIYVHIPFCRQKCYYCDFFKTVNSSVSEDFIIALKKEAIIRKNEMEDDKIETVYFGGGTPSVLNEDQFTEILHFLKDHFRVLPDAEITFEANPDDLDENYLQALNKAGFNRLSIGIQSFQNEYLKKMNRRHNAFQGQSAVENAERAGFKNISIDLIFGLPGLNSYHWIESLRRVFDLPVHHFSAYHLTYHKETLFYKWLKKGTLQELTENESIEQFNLLMNHAENAGFEQYEISNFAKDNMYSRHNTAYWSGKKYLGLGPSSHSFNLQKRRWNVASLKDYIKAINNNLCFFKEENLSENDRFNEYILTHLRTKWGVSIETISEKFGKQKAELFLKEAGKYILTNKIIQVNGIFTLSREGLFISDDIMSSFMII